MGYRAGDTSRYPTNRSSNRGRQPSERDFHDQDTARIQSVQAPEPARTRRNARRRPAAPPAAPVARRRTRRRGGRGRKVFFTLLALLVIGGVVAGAVLAASNMLVKPMVADQVGDRIDQEIHRGVQTQLQISDPATEPIFVSEADINAVLAERGDLGPVSDVTVDVTPSEIIVDVSAYGIDGRYRADVGVEEGRVRIRGGDVSGPLGLVLPAGELEDTANEAIADALSDAGYQASGVTLAEDGVTISLEQPAESGYATTR